MLSFASFAPNAGFFSPSPLALSGDDTEGFQLILLPLGRTGARSGVAVAAADDFSNAAIRSRRDPGFGLDGEGVEESAMTYEAIIR